MKWWSLVLATFEPGPRPVWLLVLAGALASAGCVTKGAADARARAAFLTGQRQAAMMARQNQRQFQGPTVTVLGEVQNSLVPWTLDLTLAKAVVDANYYGRTDPTLIVIQRDGKEIPYDPRTLLNGQDVPLQPNDVIELRH